MRCDGRCAEPSVAVGKKAFQVLAVAMLVGVDENFGFFDRHEAAGMTMRFFPFEEAEVVVVALAVKIVVEVGFLMDLAIVDVDGGEEEAAVIAAREGKGHRMNARGAGFEFEDGETVIVVAGDLFPNVGRDAEAFIETGEVFHGWDERGFEVADLGNFED